MGRGNRYLLLGGSHGKTLVWGAVDIEVIWHLCTCVHVQARLGRCFLGISVLWIVHARATMLIVMVTRGHWVAAN